MCGLPQRKSASRRNLLMRCVRMPSNTDIVKDQHANRFRSIGVLGQKRSNDRKALTAVVDQTRLTGRKYARHPSSSTVYIWNQIHFFSLDKTNGSTTRFRAIFALQINRVLTLHTPKLRCQHSSAAQCTKNTITRGTQASRLSLAINRSITAADAIPTVEPQQVPPELRHSEVHRAKNTHSNAQMRQCARA